MSEHDPSDTGVTPTTANPGPAQDAVAPTDAPTDFVGRAWGHVSPGGRLLAIVVSCAVVFGGTIYAVTAYGPNEIETAVVVDQYTKSSSGSRSICGIEVQIESGEKGRAAGDSLCRVYEEGDQVPALVSTLTGEVVGVRHAGQDFGRSGNALIGLVPMAALATLVTALIAARRDGQPELAPVAGSLVGGAVLGVAVYWLFL